MSPSDRDPGLDPEDEIELAGLIETLRGATPTREVLAPVRTEVMRAEGRRAARPATRRTAWQLAAVLAIAFALGVLARDAVLGSSGPIAALPEAAPSAPAPIVTAVETPALALVPAPPVEVIADDVLAPSPVVRFVETAGSFPPIDEDEPETGQGGDGPHCQEPTAP